MILYAQSKSTCLKDKAFWCILQSLLQSFVFLKTIDIFIQIFFVLSNLFFQMKNKGLVSVCSLLCDDISKSWQKSISLSHWSCILQGIPNTLLTLHINHMLPVHVVKTSMADKFYAEKIGTSELGVRYLLAKQLNFTSGPVSTQPCLQSSKFKSFIVTA